MVQRLDESLSLKYCGLEEHNWNANGSCIACREKLNDAYRAATSPSGSWPDEVKVSKRPNRQEYKISAIERSLDEMCTILNSKNADYRIDGEFSNFEFAADIAGLNVVDVMLIQIGIKLGRLKGAEGSYNNESAQDTIRDLAGYAIILNAYINHKEQ